MSENSPTEDGVDPNAGAEQALPADSTDSSAEGQQDAASSGNAQDADQGQSNEPDASQSTQDDDASSSDEDLTKFAKAQGIDDYTSLTEREKKILKTAHDNQKAYRKSTQDKSDELKQTLEDAEKPTQEELDSDVDGNTELRAEVNQLRAAQRVESFYGKNPEAREYETEMKDLVLEEVKTNGTEAARYLSSDLGRLLTLAKARRGDSTEDAKAQGAREEREKLRKRQEGSSDSGQAQNSHSTPKKVTRDWIDSEYDPGNAEHRQMLDEAIQRGDLY